MSTLYAYSKVKPKLMYYGLPLEKAVEILDWYVSNYDSYEFNEAGIHEFFYIRMTADLESDEYHSEYTGTYSVEFKGYIYGGDADSTDEHNPWDGTMKQLGNLRGLIKSKFGIE